MDSMAQLAALEGRWTSQMTYRDGDAVHIVGEGSSEIASILGGRGVEQRRVIDWGPDGETTQVRLIYSFDNHKQVYRIMALDEGSGLMDIYEGGAMDGDRITVTNLRAQTPFRRPDGSELYFRLTFVFESEDVFEMQVEASADEGATWSQYFVARYTRVS